MGNSNALFESIFKRKLSAPGTREYLTLLSKEYPYFSPAQFFLLLITEKGTTAYQQQAFKTAVLFNNPYWLQFQLQEQQQDTGIINNSVFSNNFQFEHQESVESIVRTPVETDVEINDSIEKPDNNIFEMEEKIVWSDFVPPNNDAIPFQTQENPTSDISQNETGTFTGENNTNPFQEADSIPGSMQGNEIEPVITGNLNSEQGDNREASLVSINTEPIWNEIPVIAAPAPEKENLEVYREVAHSNQHENIVEGNLPDNQPEHFLNEQPPFINESPATDEFTTGIEPGTFTGENNPSEFSEIIEDTIRGNETVPFITGNLSTNQEDNSEGPIYSESNLAEAPNIAESEKENNEGIREIPHSNLPENIVEEIVPDYQQGHFLSGQDPFVNGSQATDEFTPGNEPGTFTGENNHLISGDTIQESIPINDSEPYLPENGIPVQESIIEETPATTHPEIFLTEVPVKAESEKDNDGDKIEGQLSNLPEIELVENVPESHSGHFMNEGSPLINEPEPGDESTTEEANPPLQFKLNIDTSNTREDSITFEPLHTTDYFASLGIKSSGEIQPSDKLGKQLKSFTEWLKTMKKIHSDQLPPLSGQTDISIQKLAEKSNQEDVVVTEAMADVLLQQGKSEKAIEVYKKLSLLNPSKSAYFAAKIDQLKEH